MKHNRITRHYLPKSLLGGVLLAAGVLAVSSSQATVTTYDGFAYPITGPLSIDNQSGGTGWDANWGQFLGGASNYGITNGSLADPSGLLFTGSNSVFTAGGFAGRYFTDTSWGTPGTKYLSILIRPLNTPATNHYYALQLFSNCANTGSGYDVLVGKNGSGLNWGLEYSKSPTSCNAATNTTYFDAYSAVPAVANQTVLLVVRVDFLVGGMAGDPDVFTLYVNPTPGASEPLIPDAILTNDIGSVNGLALNTGNGGLARFDEIRLGTTFSSVTPTSGVPDPNLISYEPFAYNQGVITTTLDGQPASNPGSNGWDNVTWGQFLGGATNYSIVSGSLASPSGNLVTSGNHVFTKAGITNDSFAGRYSNYSALPAHTNANPTYYSFLIRPDDLGPTNGVSFMVLFGQPSGNDMLAGRVYGSTFWGLQNSTNQALSTVAAVSNQTAFLVVRGNYAANGLNTFSLYVNPTPGAPEPVTPDATLTYVLSSSPPQNGLAMRVQNGAAASFDEIRIGTNYADVTPAVAVVNNPFNITSITKSGNNVVLTWNTTGGNTNAVQVTSGSGGNYNTNGFVSINSMLIVATPGSAVVTNYTDVGGATNQPARYYRVRQVP